MWWLYDARVVEGNSVGALVAASPEHLEGEELQPNDGEGIVDDEDEEEDAEKARSKGHHRVHDVPVMPLQSDQPVERRARIPISCKPLSIPTCSKKKLWSILLLPF